MKKRVVEFVVGAMLLAAVALIGCGGSILPQAGLAMDGAARGLEVVCVEESPRCLKAKTLLAIARRAYGRAVEAEANGKPDAAALIDQAARDIEDLIIAVNAP